MRWSAGEQPSSRQIGITVGVAVLVAGIATALVFATSAPGARIVIIGDSITAMSVDPIRSGLGDGYDVRIAATSGRRIDEQMDVATGAAGRDNEQVIINLGTNDVLQDQQDLEASAASLRQMVALFPDVRCIHLVTVSDGARGMGVALTAEQVAGRAGRINAEIRALAAADPRITVIDWDQQVRDYEAANPDDSPTSDTIHPNGVGKQMLVDDYRAALSACPE